MISMETKNKLENFNYNIPYTKGWGCVMIESNNWLANTTSIFQVYNTNGKIGNNGITKIIKTNYNEEMFGTDLKENDTVLINYLYARALESMSYKIDNTEHKYGNVHVTGVIGKFKDNVISFETLQPLFDYVIMEKININLNEGLFVIPDNKTIIGRILKQGTHRYNKKWEKQPLQINVNDEVLLRSNSVTKIILNNTEYLCAREEDIVGRIVDSNLELLNNILLLERNQAETFNNSTIMKSTVDIEEKEYLSNLYESNRFKVVLSTMNEVYKDDIVYVDTNLLTHCNYKGREYHVLNNKVGLVCKVI